MMMMMMRCPGTSVLSVAAPQNHITRACAMNTLSLVQFTTGVIEKLAGIRRPEPPKPAPHPLQSPHPVLPG